MQRITIVILISILIFSSVAYAGPSLTLNTRVHDFGRVKQGDPLKFDFKLTNVGDKDIIIEKLQPN